VVDVPSRHAGEMWVERPLSVRVCWRWSMCRRATPVRCGWSGHCLCGSADGGRCAV